MRNFALHNLRDVLRAVFYTPGITRSEISENLRISPATVTKYSEILLSRHIIREAENTKGRNVALFVNSAWHATLGVDIGGFLTRIGILKSSGEFAVLDEFPTPRAPGDIGRAIHAHAKDVDAVGIAVTAVVDPRARRIFIFPNMRTWDGFDFSVLDIKGLSLTTSGNAAANHEKKFGALRGFHTCMHVNIGYGIQAGLFVNDAIVEGANHAAGEFGHVFSTADAGPCSCGNTGCLENVVTVPMIERHTRERLAAGEMRGTLSLLCGSDPAKLTLAILRQAYLQHDPQATAAVRQAAAAFGSALSGIVNVLNPQAICLGGRLIDIFPEIVEEIRSAAKLKALETNSRDLAVVKAASPLYAACAGAALGPMQEFIEGYAAD